MSFNLNIVRTALFGLSTFALGGLLMSGNAAIGQAPCATVAATAAATIAPTAAGTAVSGVVLSKHTGTHKDPVPFGETEEVINTSTDGTKTTFYLKIAHVTTGDAATSMVVGANNLFNKAPPAGSSYLVAALEGQIVSSASDTPFKISTTDFRSLSDGQLSDIFSDILITPKPELTIQAFAPAKFKGNVVLTVFSDDPAPELVYGVSYDGSGGVYFDTK